MSSTQYIVNGKIHTSVLIMEKIKQDSGSYPLENIKRCHSIKDAGGNAATNKNR